MSRIDACLPLLARDLPRFGLLRQSLETHFDALGCCWVLVPDGEYQTLKPHFKAPFVLLPESALFPQLRYYQWLSRLFHGRLRSLFPYHRKRRFQLTGWYRQQLIKLGIARLIETDFYLTLDADVVCIKPTTHADLVRAGRARVTTEPEDVHPEWYAHATRVLGLARSGRNHGVTPSLLHREGVLALHAHLESRFTGVWWQALIRHTPWTEYTLYHTFMEGTGRWDAVHVDAGAQGLYDTEASFWWQGDHWSVEDAIRGSAHFVVVQSNTGVPVDIVHERLEAAGVFTRTQR